MRASKMDLYLAIALVGLSAINVYALQVASPLPHGISVEVNGAAVALEVQGTSAFRLGVGRDGP